MLDFPHAEGQQLMLARALFAPRAVALIGASGDAGKNTARPQRYLRKHGYAGRIAPVNPRHAEVLGEKAFPSLDAIPGEIDHALILNAVLDMERLPAGATSLVSQSGTMLGTMLSRGAARGLGFAKLVSIG